MGDKQIITHKDESWIYKQVESIAQVREVQDYLRVNDLKIEITKTHCAQSGWTGENVMLEGRNLSGNGFCFSGKRLLEHVRFHREALRVSSSGDYKRYLDLKERFEYVENYLTK